MAITPYSSSQLFCVLWRTEILKTEQIKIAVFIIIHVKRFSLVFLYCFLWFLNIYKQNNYNAFNKMLQIWFLTHSTLHLNFRLKFAECEPGTTGNNCSLTCPPEFFGIQCREQCNCSLDKYCDPTSGCLANKSVITSTGSGILSLIKVLALSLPYLFEYFTNLNLKC